MEEKGQGDKEGSLHHQMPWVVSVFDHQRRQRRNVSWSGFGIGMETWQLDHDALEMPLSRAPVLAPTDVPLTVALSSPYPSCPCTL